MTEYNNTVFPGKIAIVTTHASISKNDYYPAEHLMAKYGADKIIHVTFPADFMACQEKTADIVAALAADKEVKALIFNQPLPGTNAAVEKLKEIRNDIFIVYCAVLHELRAVSIMNANLSLLADEVSMGPAMVNQAQKQGAKVFVYYSFPRHMAMRTLIRQRDLVRETCMTKGIQFVEVEIPDPQGEAGPLVAQQFIHEDVSRCVDKYGEDTAFFSTNCTVQPFLLKAVIDCHAIYPQPCCPSPYHGFPEALGIQTNETMEDLMYVITEASRIAAEKNMTDRLSTWPVSASMMFTNAATEYAIKWIKGEVPKSTIDDKVLVECMNAYIKEVIGEESNIFITAYTDNGITYNNLKYILMSYLDL